tara:strand:+ start:36955 stop:37188 length:234 start_codon:yes stop_codon:yes gene_type:complete
MKSQQFSFTNNNGYQLSAQIEFPVNQKPLAFAIFAHCLTCSTNLQVIKHINRGLTSKGIAVLLFDFTGLGGSEGERV